MGPRATPARQVELYTGLDRLAGGGVCSRTATRLQTSGDELNGTWREVYVPAAAAAAAAAAEAGRKERTRRGERAGRVRDPRPIASHRTRSRDRAVGESVERGRTTETNGPIPESIDDTEAVYIAYGRYTAAEAATGG